MIRNGKSGKTAQAVANEVSTAMESRLAEFERLENEVVKWIKSNPLLGVGIALAIGAGLGWAMKHRR